MTAHNNDVGALPHETEMYQTTVQSVKDFIDANTDTLAISVITEKKRGKKKKKKQLISRKRGRESERLTQ